MDGFLSMKVYQFKKKASSEHNKIKMMRET